MLNHDQLSNAIADVSAEHMHVDDFERWFRVQSRGAHLLADSRLLEEVFAIEAVLSEYHASDMADEIASRELVNAIRPFAESRWEVEVVSPGVFQLKERYPERPIATSIATSEIIQRIRKPPTREIALQVSARRSDLEVVLA